LCPSWNYLLDQDRLVVLARDSCVHSLPPHQHQQTPPESTESSSGRHSFVTVDELSIISSTQVRCACSQRGVVPHHDARPPSYSTCNNKSSTCLHKSPASSALSLPTTPKRLKRSKPGIASSSLLPKQTRRGTLPTLCRCLFDHWRDCMTMAAARDRFNRFGPRAEAPM
jgi:hypothetical protein